MKTTSRLASAALLVMTASAAIAAPTDYAFDTVTKFDIQRIQISVTGVLRNTTTPTTVTFVNNTNIDNQHVMNRCEPAILTMMEKPGRYYLNLRIDPAESFIQLISCGLELRS